jgi:hypothetical protein
MRDFFSVEIILTFLIGLILSIEVIAQQVKDVSSGKTLISKPPILIYKMKRDYSRNIPVLLSDDKKEIVSYPHPLDIMGMASKDVMPIRLHDGFYLDRRGINKNVAFLRITYGSYRKLRKPLSIKEIEKNIIDRNPLVEIYSCPSLSEKENIVSILNSAIDSKTLFNICN